MSRSCYVYRIEPVLGLRTNVPPEMWVGEIDKFLEDCPDRVHIVFNIVDGKPIETSRKPIPRP